MKGPHLPRLRSTCATLPATRIRHRGRSELVTATFQGLPSFLSSTEILWYWFLLGSTSSGLSNSLFWRVSFGWYLVPWAGPDPGRDCPLWGLWAPCGSCLFTFSSLRGIFSLHFPAAAPCAQFSLFLQSDLPLHAREPQPFLGPGLGFHVKKPSRAEMVLSVATLLVVVVACLVFFFLRKYMAKANEISETLFKMLIFPNYNRKRIHVYEHK